MRALVLDGTARYTDAWPQPVPAQGEALVRVTLAGICGTDLELCRGYYPFRGVLGHEFVGVVEQALDRAWVGARVTASINLGCGTCGECRAHGPEHCAQRRVLGIHGHDGAFADYVAVPLANLHRLPDSVPDEVAVFTEPVAAALRLRDQALVTPSSRTAVLGAGRLGLLVGQVLALDGAAVTLLVRRPESLALPRQLGLTAALASEAEPGFDLVVDATGTPAGLARAIELTRPRGVLGLKSTYAGDQGVNLSQAVVKELTLVGSRCGPFAPALRLLERGAVRTAELVAAEYPVPDGEQALVTAGRAGMLKVLLRV